MRLLAGVSEARIRVGLSCCGDGRSHVENEHQLAATDRGSPPICSARGNFQRDASAAIRRRFRRDPSAPGVAVPFGALRSPMLCEVGNSLPASDDSRRFATGDLAAENEPVDGSGPSSTPRLRRGASASMRIGLTVGCVAKSRRVSEKRDEAPG